MNKSAFAFKKVANETLEKKALRACEVILKSGIGIRGGKIVAGGNSVMADNAANAFSDNDIIALHQTDMGMLAGMAINSRKKYIESIDEDNSLNLRNCAAYMVRMREFDWNTDATPTNFDLNAVGAHNETYAEPTPIVEQLLAAFAKVRDDKTHQIGQSGGQVSVQQSLGTHGLTHRDLKLK